ncbi:hypothetical protein P154DRAFT_528078 [Amniculicola lignicola CBS 123094]|uniref:Fungal N-terminal domain-containing protein n=1 Tax=Amniculicola lignicola CBS 123094 TaxID=1392246 RepID=A0A6A5VUG5_9PLEO|nr:hypothetical protein P154DRAFT_528078 [Amniculicola lignicola CBS 123094]
MDPLSMTAAIGSICGVTVKLIFSISEFIDSAQQAPTEVQSLSNELASLYAGFGHIRVAVQAPRVSSLPDKWKDNFDKLMADCEDTLKQVQDLIEKAKITETKGTIKLVWKSVKFVFKEKQVEFLRRRITSQNSILQNLFVALTETRGNYIEQRLEDIHGKVEELVASRSKVREVLVVLEKEDDTAQDVDYVLSDRRKSAKSQQTGTGDSMDTDDVLNDELERQPPGNKGMGNGERDNSTSPAGASSTPTTAQEPTLAQLMSKVSQMNSALESLSRRLPSEENVPLEEDVSSDDSLSIVKSVMNMTRPSSHAQEALRMVDTRIWALQVFRERRAEETTWSPNTIYDNRFKDCQLLRFKLFIKADEETLYLQFLPDRDDAVRFPTYRRWRDAETILCGSTVTTRVPSYAEDNKQVFWQWDDEFTFRAVQDAKDFQFCFTHLCSMLQRIRKVQVAACSHINPHIALGSPLETEKAAYWLGHKAGFGMSFNSGASCAVM